MNPLRKLASQTVIYGLSSIIGRAVNFLLVPFYTGIFGGATYGVVNELYTYVAFFNVIYAFGLETAYFRFSNKDDHSEGNVFNTAVTFILTVSLLLSGLFYVGANEIAEMIRYSGKGEFIRWLALILAIDAVVAIPFARFRFENKAITYASLKLANIFLNVGLNLFFLILCRGVHYGEIDMGNDWWGDLYSEDIGVGYVFISNLIANGLYLPLLLKSFSRVRFRIRWKELKPMLKYSYPIMFMGLAGVANEAIDRPMIKFLWTEGMYGMTGQQAMGIYGACYKLGMFMTLGIQAMRYAAEPFFFSRAKDKDAPKLFARVMDWYVLLACLIFVFISVNRSWIGDLFLGKPEYNQGLFIVPIILMANLFLGIYYNMAIWFKLSDRTYWGTILQLVGMGVTVLGNFLLIPLIGFEGSAWTTLICYFLMTVLSYFLGHKYYPVPYNVPRNLVFIGISALIVFVFNVFV